MRSPNPPGLSPNSLCFSFTPSDLAQELFFYPTWCGHFYCNHHYFIKRETYPPLLVAYVRKGMFHVEYRGQTFEAEKGDVLLLDCREPHYYHAHDGLEFVYIHFDGSNSREICQLIMAQSGSLIRDESNILIGNLLYNMVKFHENGGVETLMLSSARIYRILEYLLASNLPQAMEDDTIQNAISYIRSNSHRKITVDELANISNFSASYFAHRFKQYTGFSPMDFVINTRLEKAKSLLIRTSKSVAEITDEVGYSSSTCLINIFEKRIGSSPKQYRKMHQSHP
jgi:AraC-like DNA-binding protein